MIPFLNLAVMNAEVAEELTAAIHAVILGNNLILGPQVEAFETEFAAYCEKTYCVGVGCGLDALTLMLLAYGIGPGDEVIVAANGYIATWLAVTRVGAQPVPVEPEFDSMNMDSYAAAAAVTDRTKAILVTHLYGRCADMPALLGVAISHNILLLVDAAQAHGIKGANLGDCAAFSFYPTKNLGALGDGGAIVTSDKKINNAARLLRNYGSRIKDHNEVIGVNSRLDELQAAVLRVKLKKLDEWNARRLLNALQYTRQLLPLDIGRPKICVGNVWHLYVVQVERRSLIRKHLLAEGVGTAVHYPTPPHLQPAYAGLGYSVGSFPIAERLATEVVSLPIGPEVTCCTEIGKMFRHIFENTILRLVA